MLATYLGLNSKKELRIEYEKEITTFIKNQNDRIDSIINSKNILQAGIYIVNDIVYNEDQEYRFEDLKTIDNKKLPTFLYPPKLIINTSTGENLRIKKVTTTSFILSAPIAKSYSLFADGDNKDYPKVVKFDVWIADYKTE